MEPLASAAAIRAAEQAWFDAHPGGDLMGRAAAAVARAAAGLLTGRESWGVLVVAGPGNNAGDALFAAAELPELLGRPLPIHIWPVAGHTHADGLAAALDEGAEVIDAAAALLYVTGTGLVIDGLSGLGGRPGLPDAAAAVARAASDAGVPVLAVDLPSGLVADSVQTHPSFLADVTVTFLARKLAQVAQPAASACGRVELFDLGVAVPEARIHRVEAADLHAWYPWPGPLSDKYSRGVVGLDTGSQAYPGAAVLGVDGALHAGAGMVRYAGPARDAVLAHFPNVVAPIDAAEPGRVQSWVCGSGWADADPQRLRRRVADGVPMVLDAGALIDLPPDLPPGSLLTPHAGELARLLGVERAAVTTDPLGHAERAARATGAVVLLKGATQFCVTPDGAVLIAEPGPAWSATAGSGDTLAGIAGTLLAAGLDPWRAGALAASLQARAARAWPGPRTPQDVSTHGLPAALTELAGLGSVR